MQLEATPGNLVLATGAGACGRMGSVSFLSGPPLSDSPSGSLDDARERVDGHQKRLSLGFVPFHLLLVGAESQHLGFLGPRTWLWAWSNLEPMGRQRPAQETHLRGQICLGILKV